MARKGFWPVIARIFVVLLILIVILNLAGVATMTLSESISIGASAEISDAFVTHSAMLILSILVILAVNRGRLSPYGFSWPLKMRFGHILALGLAGGIVSSLIGSLLPGSEHSLLADASFLEIVLFVWIWASICEEVLMRGLIQGYLQPLMERGLQVAGLRLSVPVFVSAVLFGLMHFNPMVMSMGIFRSLNIVFFAIILGLIAGYYREKTGSLIPAILVHALFNVGGTLTGYGMEFL